MPIASAKLIIKEKAQKEITIGNLKEAMELLMTIPNYQEDIEICKTLVKIALELNLNNEAEVFINLGLEIDNEDEELNGLYKRMNSSKEDNEDREEKEEDEEDKIKKKFLPKAEIPKERFVDIIGMINVKEKLQDKVILAIKRPELFEKYDKQRNAGIILYGSPGTGKTFIVKALAGETKMKFIEAKISEVVSKWTGDTEKNIEAIFQNARENAPCIIFFDELDSLGQKRSNLSGEGSAVVMKQAIEAFLMSMDGVSSSKDNIYVIGATNQPWDIDEALKRPGRFGDSIYINLPKYKERKELFKYYLKKIKVPTYNIKYGRLARATFYYSPADIKEICEEVKLKAITYENTKNKEKRIKTIDLLSSIRKRESSSISWFNTIKKDLISIKKVDKVDGRKVKSELQGKLTKAERDQYKPLIKEFNNYLNRRDLYRFIRFFSIFIM